MLISYCLTKFLASYLEMSLNLNTYFMVFDSKVAFISIDKYFINDAQMYRK